MFSNNMKLFWSLCGIMKDVSSVNTKEICLSGHLDYGLKLLCVNEMSDL